MIDVHIMLPKKRFIALATKPDAPKQSRISFEVLTPIVIGFSIGLEFFSTPHFTHKHMHPFYFYYQDKENLILAKIPNNLYVSKIKKRGCEAFHTHA